MSIKTPLFILVTFCLSLPFTTAQEMSDAQKEALQERAAEVNEACAYPDKPSIPDGRNSTRDEMIEAQTKMKTFIAEGNEYIACLDEVEANWGDDATDEEKSVIVVLHNKAVDEMQSVADLFNAALRAFQGKQ